MDKRLGLALVISMGILFAWWKLFPPPVPPPPAPPGAAAPAAQTQAPAAPASAPGPGPQEAAGAVPAAAVPAARPAEERVAIETEQVRFVLSSWGATLREIMLKEEKFRERKQDPQSGLQIIGTRTPETAALRTSFPKADFTLREDAAWSVARAATNAVVFRTETPAIAIEKRYRAAAEPFQLHLEIVIENKSGKSIDESLAVHLFGRQDPEKKGGGFLDYASANVAEMVCYNGDSVERHAIESLRKEPRDFLGNVLWVAADEKFVTLALVPFRETAARDRKCGLRAVAADDLVGEAFLSFAGRTIPAGGQTSYELVVFGGPKYTHALDQVRPGGHDPQLGEIVNVSFAVLARPLLFLLKLFHRFSGNWGLAIILLTIFVKIVTFYPTHRTMMSAKKMMKLAPKVAALRKKYENDRQRMGVETMNLYKAHGVSPFGGCLPSLIQMPIWIALFSTLNYAVELHRSSFLGYIHDLSAKDPYYITPLLMGGVMFLQMRMSPAGADPQQQKMMSIMMPVMFTAFSLFLPAGLAVYTLTSYLIGILQQLWVNHLDRRANPPATGRAARA